MMNAISSSLSNSILPVVAVVDPAGSTEVDPDAVLAGKQCFIGLGKAINSRAYNGMATDDVKAKITEKLSTAGIGREAVNYKLRDWLFSRQRFWGEPFPILHELDACGQTNRSDPRSRRQGLAGEPSALGRLQTARQT